jgi:hypothetical protein
MIILNVKNTSIGDVISTNIIKFYFQYIRYYSATFRKTKYLINNTMQRVHIGKMYMIRNKIQIFKN